MTITAVDPWGYKLTPPQTGSQWDDLIRHAASPEAREELIRGKAAWKAKQLPFGACCHAATPGQDCAYAASWDCKEHGSTRIGTSD